MLRTLQQIIAAQPASDGAGVRIQRVAHHGVMNPFLMLDEIHSETAEDYLAGFPEHPHRGFETITYMKAGRMRHRDHMGNEGVIEPGGVQWMAAGRGVIHSEMPEQESGLMHGFQIWLNLPAAEKMMSAAYRDIPAREMGQDKRGQVRVIAGHIELQGESLTGPLPTRSTHPVLCDVELEAHQPVELVFAPEQPAWVYVYQGELAGLQRGQFGSFTRGSVLSLVAGGTAAGALVLSGRPIDEPIVQYGPFVMNTREEIEQAMRDFRSGQLV
jgi:redox-sensitive bicupin YhaK (pirin superfamily)